MNSVESYIYHLEGEQREIASCLHDLFIERYGMTCRLRYRVPFYDLNKWLCYINPQKNKGVELCFLHGRWMDEVHVELDAKDRKQIRGITYSKLEDIDESVLEKIIQTAIEVDIEFSKLKRLPK